MKKVETSEQKIIKALSKSKSKGLTITDLVTKTKLSRSTVRITLAKMEGSKKVEIRKIGMAKVYSIRSGKK